jgi:drug/metabolite transporter, DME family
VSTARGIWLIAFAATAWGVGGFVAAILYRTSGLGPVAVSFWRFVGGLVLLAAIRGLVSGPWRAGGRRILLTGIGFAVYQTAYYAAIPHAGLAVATVVTLGTGPVLIALGARVFLRERLGLSASLLILASLIGLLLLVRPSGSDISLAGVGLALLSAGGYAAVTLLSRASHGTDDALDSALGGFAVGAVLVLPLAVMQGLLPTGGRWDETAGMLAFLGVAPTALAYLAFFSGLRAVRATTASMVALVEPLAASVLAVIVLGERLAVAGYIGGAVLLASIALLSRAERNTATPEKTETPSAR